MNEGLSLKVGEEERCPQECRRMVKDRGAVCGQKAGQLIDVILRSVGAQPLRLQQDGIPFQ